MPTTLPNSGRPGDGPAADAAPVRAPRANTSLLLLTAAYPVLTHLAVVWRLPALQAAALALLLGALLGPQLGPQLGSSATAGARAVRALVPLLAALAAAAAMLLAERLAPAQAAAQLLAYAVPVLLHGMVGWVFLRSLAPGHEPLVTAIGRLARGALGDELSRYTRRVTQLWAGVFGVLFVLSLVLPFVSRTAWSWCTNVFNYAVFALLVAGEYLYRRRRFPAHDHPGFVNYLRILWQSDVRQL